MHVDVNGTRLGRRRRSPTRSAAAARDLHRDWVEFFDTTYRVDGEIVHTREYLLVLGRRR
jgi:hypothetical protein